MTTTHDNTVLFGDCRDSMRTLIDAGVKVQTCVTSPPYWNLRDYGHPGQLGLEDTLDEYLANQVEVFRLVRDLLADDGTLWVNMGDSYAANRGAGDKSVGKKQATNVGANLGKLSVPMGYKPKDLIGQPWRLAFALQADGWYLRSDIIWSKPNPMPESVTDRPTKSHEYIFMLSKSERYYYDGDSIREPVAEATVARMSQDVGSQTGSTRANGGGKTNGAMKAVVRGSTGVGFGHGYDATTKPRARRDSFKRDDSKRGTPHHGQNFGTHRADRADSEYDLTTRNKRTVWTVTTRGYSGAHFATFPPDLIKPCILAGSRPGDIVLDPFFGSGTTGEVAQSLGRRWIGCELNPEYEPLQRERIRQVGLPV